MFSDDNMQIAWFKMSLRWQDFIANNMSKSIIYSCSFLPKTSQDVGFPAMFAVGNLPCFHGASAFPRWKGFVVFHSLSPHHP